MANLLTRHKPAHSNFRKGLNDYNDGGNITHHLGNDDYKNGNHLPDPNEEEVEFDGSEALGNELLEDDESDDQDFGRRETPDEQK